MSIVDEDLPATISTLVVGDFESDPWKLAFERRRSCLRNGMAVSRVLEKARAPHQEKYSLLRYDPICSSCGRVAAAACFRNRTARPFAAGDDAVGKRPATTGER